VFVTEKRLLGRTGNKSGVTTLGCSKGELSQREAERTVESTVSM